MERVRGAVWGMLYADDAGVVSRPAEGLARMMTVVVELFAEFGLMVSEKTVTLVMKVPIKRAKEGEPQPPPPATAGCRGRGTTVLPDD